MDLKFTSIKKKTVIRIESFSWNQEIPNAQWLEDLVSMIFFLRVWFIYIITYTDLSSPYVYKWFYHCNNSNLSKALSWVLRNSTATSFTLLSFTVTLCIQCKYTLVKEKMKLMCYYKVVQFEMISSHNFTSQLDVKLQAESWLGTVYDMYFHIKIMCWHVTSFLSLFLHIYRNTSRWLLNTMQLHGLVKTSHLGYFLARV